MKIQYETNARPFRGHHVAGHAGYGGRDCLTTSAQTPKGVIDRLKIESKRAFARRVSFYEEYPSCRRLDIYEEDHLWEFRAWVPGKLRFIAFAEMRRGRYNSLRFAWFDHKAGSWCGDRSALSEAEANLHLDFHALHANQD